MADGTTAHYRAFSPSRILAMVERYWYLLRSSWPRLLDLIYCRRSRC